MLSAIGNVLDLPGSMARDALMLRNPLDQIFDPFGQSGRTSGQEMLDAVGLQNSPWLSMGLEMALDPTSYVGVGAANAGLKGLGLAKNGLGIGSKLGKAAKLAKFAARHPQRAVNALAVLPNASRGMPTKLWGQAKSGLADFFTSAAGKADELKKAVMGGTDEVARAVGGVADDAVEKTAARSVENAASVSNHPIPSSLDQILGDQYLTRLPRDQVSKLMEGTGELSDAIRMEGIAMDRDIARKLDAWNKKNQGMYLHGKNRAEVRAARFGAVKTKRLSKMEQQGVSDLYDQFVKQYMPQPELAKAAPVMAQAAPAVQVAPEAIAQALQPSRFSTAMDKTIYNPDVMRLLLGGAIPYASASGRSTNPTSHAYMGY